MDEMGCCLGQGLITLGGTNNEASFQPILTLGHFVSISEVESPKQSVEEKNALGEVGVDFARLEQPSTAGSSAARSCAFNEVDLSSGGFHRGVASFQMHVSQSACDQASCKLSRAP